MHRGFFGYKEIFDHDFTSLDEGIRRNSPYLADEKIHIRLSSYNHEDISIV